MVDYINTRKFYTTNGAFLSGNDAYEGYVIRNGSNFTDVYNYPLTAAPSFSTDLVSSNYFRDRVISENLSLPNRLSSIEININDILTNQVINDKLASLNDNNTFLYRSLQAPTNYLPASDNVKFAGLSSYAGVEQFAWFNSTITTLEYLDSTNYKGLENIEHGIAVLSDYDENTFTMFCTTSSTLIALTGNDTSLTRIEESLYVSQSGSDHQFNEITSMDYDNNYLYVCDKGNNAVYKYDIQSYRTGDTTYFNRRVLEERFGSIGGVDDKGQLNAPTLVAVKSDTIAIYDSGNRVLKIYDQNFNFRTKFSTGNFKREPAVAIRYNKFTNELYVITVTTERTLRLYRVQEDFTISDAINLEETLTDGESVKEITFSQNNSNYWYLTTTSFIYKKLVSRPESNIGAYDGAKIFVYFTYKWNYSTFTYDSAAIAWNTSTNKTATYDNFIGITIEPSVDDKDKVFMFKYGRFYKFDEYNGYLSLLNFFNKSNYSISDIKISSDEFVQPAVYNKEIYKIISNLLTLKNNIIGKYYGSYDLNGAFRLIGYNYLIDLNKFMISNIQNFVIHQNEEVNYFTINRTLRNLYNLQQTLLDAVKIDIDSLVPYPLTSNTLVVD